MSEYTFLQLANHYVNKNVEIITTQRNFHGRLLSVGKDVVVLQEAMPMRPVEFGIRIDQIVAITREDQRPRGPFGFMPQEMEVEQGSESKES